MKQTNSIVVGLLLGSLTLAEAVKLGLPDYWDPFYGDTWRYTKDPHLVDADQWIGDAPQAYTTVQLGKVPDFYANGYSDTWQHTGKEHIVDGDQWIDDAPRAYTVAQKDSRQWDPTVLKHVGKPEDYKADAPDGYKEHIVWHPPNPKTPEQERMEEREDIVKKAKVEARKSEHKVHKASLVQRKHKKHHNRVHQKERWPAYVDGEYREHAWTDEQYNNSNEQEWDEETKHPSGYQKSKKSFHQRATYPAGTHSKIKPYVHRDHAWSEEQNKNSDSASWDSETKAPTGYQVTPDSFVQRKTYPSKDSHSWIEPYTQRDHSWNIEEHDQSDEKKWGHETNHPSGYQVTPDSFAQRKTYPSKDSHSWIEPYTQRDHSWNIEEHDQSDEKKWGHETNHPSGYQVTPDSFAQRKTYPSKDSHSWIEPYTQRDHSWNIDEHDQSDEKAWGHETNHPSGYQVTPDSFAQRKTYPSKDSHSWIEPYSQRDHSWNIEEHDQSDEKKWGHETNHPSGYQVTPDSFAQRRTYPSKDSHSWIEPYTQRDHSWNIDEHDQSDEKAWGHETNHPSGYQVTPDSFAQANGKAGGKYFRVETHSKIIPYVVRDHAWNFEHHDNTNFERYRTDAPDGYKEHIQWITPHPTNKPYFKPRAPIVVEEEEEEAPKAPAGKAPAGKAPASKAHEQVKKVEAPANATKSAQEQKKTQAPPNATKPAQQVKKAEVPANTSKATQAVKKVEAPANTTKVQAKQAPAPSNVSKAAVKKVEAPANATKVQAKQAPAPSNVSKAAVKKVEAPANATKVQAPAPTNASKVQAPAPSNASKATQAVKKAEAPANVTKATQQVKKAEAPKNATQAVQMKQTPPNVTQAVKIAASKQQAPAKNETAKASVKH